MSWRRVRKNCSHWRHSMKRNCLYCTTRSRKQRLKETKWVDWTLKVNCVCFGFALCRSVIGQQNSRHFFQPVTRKTKSNRDLHACDFPRFASVRCGSFEFWLAHCTLSVCCDWLEYFFFVFGFKTFSWKPLLRLSPLESNCPKFLWPRKFPIEKDFQKYT